MIIMFAIHQFTRNDIFETEDTYSKQLQWVPFATSKMMQKKLLGCNQFLKIGVNDFDAKK